MLPRQAMVRKHMAAKLAPGSVGWAIPDSFGEKPNSHRAGGVWEPRPSLGFAALSTKLEEHFDVAC